MKLHFFLTRRANRDIEAARNWYDLQQDGLGDDFVTDIDKAISVACERSQSLSEIETEIRTNRCDRFPYRLYLTVEPDRVVILAVYHTARDPRRWNDEDRH